MLACAVRASKRRIYCWLTMWHAGLVGTLPIDLSLF